MVALANFVSRYHYVAYHCQWNDAISVPLKLGRVKY